MLISNSEDLVWREAVISARERQIRDVIKKRSVEWEELRIPSALPQGHLPQGELLSMGKPGKTCPGCGKENREQAHFCGHCGGPLRM